MQERMRLLGRGRTIAAVILVLLLVAVVGFAALRGADVQSLATLGYPGVAILMFLSSSTVLFPAPGFAAVLAAGTVWNPLLVGVAGGVGAATGELSGYLLGVGGTSVLRLHQDRRWRRVHDWLERYGLASVLLLASIPNPLFDILGVVAGSLAFPVRRFWLACAVGNSLKYVALAYLANSAASSWLLH